MSNLREKAIKIAKQTSSESAFMCGYDRACKEYEEKFRWIPIEEKLPEIKDTEYRISVRYFDAEFNSFVYNVFDVEIDYNNETLKDDLLFNDFTEWRLIL